MRTIDDRGRLMPISGRFNWRGLARPPITRTDGELADREAKRVRRATRMFVIEGIAALAFYVALIAARIAWMPHSSSPWIENPQSVLTGILPGLLMIWLIARMLRRSAATSATQDARCLACTHLLAGMPVELDGCVVCPECGAAWRVAPQETLVSDG